MANISKGLGKGLGALMGDDMMALHEEKTSLMLPISQVESCAAQPRKLFDPESGALPYAAGDRIKFEPITAAEFAALAAKEGTA